MQIRFFFFKLYESLNLKGTEILLKVAFLLSFQKRTLLAALIRDKFTQHTEKINIDDRILSRQKLCYSNHQVSLPSGHIHCL